MIRPLLFLVCMLIGLLTLFSCSKEYSCEGPGCLISNQDSTRSCDSSVCADQKEYIRAQIDGMQYCFSSFWFNHDSSYNINYSADGMDQINMIREDACKHLSIRFFFTGTNLFHQPLPYIQPLDNPQAPMGLVELQLVDLQNISSCEFCPTDSVDYVNWPFHGIQIQVSQIVNDTLVGSFSGPVYTKTGKSRMLSNGEFRIRIIR
jgi:hypothetical protein